jgi:hypothetical protein
MNIEQLSVVCQNGDWKIEHAGNYSQPFPNRVEAICHAHRLSRMMLQHVKVVIHDESGKPI